VQITFRDVDHSDALEGHIRDKAAKLEEFHPNITGCTVIVEMPAKHKHQGKLFNVRVDVRVPGSELVVNRDLHEDVYVALRDAFDAAKRQLDEFAAKTTNAKAFMIEVAGHTDSTGGEAKNFRLSQERAESVVQYLAVAHKISLRRFVTPMGYGKTEAVADNSTAEGRAQNRRVEVKMLLNRGMTQQPRATSAAKP